MEQNLFWNRLARRGLIILSGDGYAVHFRARNSAEELLLRPPYCFPLLISFISCEANNYLKIIIIHKFSIKIYIYVLQKQSVFLKRIN